MLAIIGGTGLDRIDFISPIHQHKVMTPYGEPSSLILEGKVNSHQFFFLSRHGTNHTIAPHKVNYRANVWALHSLGIKNIIAVAAVGSMDQNFPPQSLMLPDQVIDYTWGREHTFFDGSPVEHIEFSHPFDDNLRQKLIVASENLNIKIIDGGTYGVTQGPRLETQAEIRRLRQDGCDIVGMTAMPEAALARELNINYASIAVCANWAAGISDQEIKMNSILNNLEKGVKQLIKVLKEYLK